MKKILSMLVMLAMLLALCMGAAAENTLEGQIVTQGVTRYFKADGTSTNNTRFPGGDAVVELKKTVETTGVENEFEVLLSVRTTQNIQEIRSDTPDAAAMLILDVSNSMDDCIYCGKESSEHGRNTSCSSSEYKSRLTEAKEKANAFIDEFATDTGAESGDKRYVAIVDFGSMSARRLDWVDVTNATQRARAKQIINGLTVAHSGTTWNSSDDGGTNIEAALMLGANVWNSTSVSNIDYKYTILLTDGNPTYHVSDNQSSTSDRTDISGTKGGGNSTTLADVKDVGKQADRILGLGSLSKLYSICFGKNVASSRPFQTWTQADPRTTDNMTVLQWLDAFSTDAYEAEDAQGLFDSFNSIITQIQLAAQAWQVEDVMGEYAVYGGEVDRDHYNNFTFENGTLHWDVLRSNVASVSTYDNGRGAVLEYTLKYKVTLDNLNEDYNAHTAADTNTGATLTYAVLDSESGLWEVLPPVEFPKPQVQGYDADLSFTKVYLDGETEKPIPGMQFRLVSASNSETGETWGPVTGTSDNNGVVTFEGVPSGHTYYLRELNAGNLGFADSGDIPVTVSLGTATSSLIRNGKLMNVKTDKEVTLTLRKEFSSTDHPTSVAFVITNAKGYHREVTLNEGNNWEAVFSGLEPGVYTITENAEMNGYTLTPSAELFVGTDTSGKTLPVNNSSVQAELTLESQQSHAAYTVKFTNSYVRKVGGPVSISKQFIEGFETPTEIDSSKYAGVEIEIDFVNANGQSEEIVTLDSSNDWQATLTTLPIGTYTIEETIRGTEIPDHDFITMQLVVNGQTQTGNRVTIQEGTQIGIVMNNRYVHHVGDINVQKLFEGADDAVIPSDKVFYIDVYEAVESNGGYTKGAKITEIEIRQNVSGHWVGTSEDIRVGKYYLEERADSTTIDGYTFQGFEFNIENNIVEVTNSAAPAYVTLTNTYERDMGTLTISKQFSGLPDDLKPDYIYVNVIRSSDNRIETTVTLSKTSNPAWQTSVELPLGEYYLDEVTAAGAEGTADIEDYGHTLSWSPSASVNLTKENNVFATTVTNTYVQNFGKLTISKAFDFSDLTQGEAEAAAALGINISFLVQQQNASGTYETVDTISLNSTAGWSKTVDLPNGTYRLLERGARLNSDAGYTFDSLTVTVNNGEKQTLSGNTAGETGFNVTITGSDTQHDVVTVHATNNYVRDTGSITVQKAFGTDADSQAAAAQLSNIDVLVFSGGVRVAKLTLSKDTNPAWTATTDQLPVGKYTLVEAHTKDAVDAQGNALNSAYVEGYNLTYAWDGGAEVELTKGQTAAKTVTNTYSRRTGRLALYKRFMNMPEAIWPEISVNVMQGDDLIETITLDSNPWHKEITLPVGTYTLVESSPDSYEGYSQTGTTFKVNDGHDSTITEVQTNTVDVTVLEGTTPSVRVYLTNTYSRDTGTITVTKTFADDLSKEVAKDKKINVLVKNAQGRVVETLTLAAANPTPWTATTRSLPTGTYTLEEVTARGQTNTAFIEYYTVVADWQGQDSVQLNKGDVLSVTVENTYTQDVGSLTVKKTVVSAYDSDKQKEFSFTMALDMPISGTYGDLTFNGGVATFTLRDGNTITAAGLPAGAVCTVTEAAEEGFITTVHGIKRSSISDTIQKADAVVEFVNTRGASAEELVIHKIVDSPLRSDYSKAFTFTVKMDDTSVAGVFDAKSVIGGTAVDKKVTFADGAATVTLKHDEAIRIIGLPKGMSFTVTEAEDPGFVVTANGDNVNHVKGLIGEANAEFVNTSTVGKAALTVSKTVDGNASSKDDVFTFEVRIPDLMDGVYGDMTFAGGVATVQLKHGEKAKAQGIPVGAAYTVTETDCGNYTPNVPAYEGTMTAKGAEAAFVNTLELVKLPETGDNSRIALWCVMLALAGAGLMLIRRRKA